MKILLTAINSKYIHSNLAVRYLKKFTERLDYECIIREFSINDRDERILEEIIKEKPQVVAFSTYIWNIEVVTRLSYLIKAVDESIEILYGGPEVSYDSMNILKELPGEYIIEGEGEKTYKEFVEYKLGMKSIEEIRGLYYKKDNEIFINGKRPLMNMDEIVFPYDEDENLDIVIERRKKFDMKPMSPEEAVLQMELVGHDFYMFRNIDTDEISIVYRRETGGYGLIEHE